MSTSFPSTLCVLFVVGPICFGLFVCGMPSFPLHHNLPLSDHSNWTLQFLNLRCKNGRCRSS
eukprot:m.95838 g.95838  ORF g.95838 m.95838 type:complete len:62 (+) comp8764_c0_seq1:3071-3256(+)